ncbi:MAG: hypothetical protein AAGB34_00210 [Planctomycetota bacterium]
MSNRSNLIQFIAASFVILGVVFSGVFSRELSAEAGRSQLVYTDRAEEGDPPEVGVAIALGAFRGLFVNYLWMRANSLKEEGKFYEAIELSNLITRLQPRFPRVWAFHAWNMSYNISVATETREERWQWVKAGIDLIRSEGIPANPNDILLHKELAWIFFHKIGGFADDANRYYKKELAQEWTYALGVPPSVPQDHERAKEIRYEWFKPIAEAPRSIEGAIERELRELRELAPPGSEGPFASGIEELVDQLETRAAIDIRTIEGIEFVLRITLLIDERQKVYDESLMNEIVSDNASILALRDLWNDEEHEGAWDALLPHLRHKLLVERYSMEPTRMLRYIDHYGPLDFRHSASHSLYWAARGVEVGLTRQGTTNFNSLNTDRTVIHSVQELFRSGTVFYDVVSDEYFATLDLNFAEAYGQVIEGIIERNNNTQGRDRAYTTFSAGFENFLADVIRVFYRLGEIETARAFRVRLLSWDGLNLNNRYKFIPPDGEHTWPLEKWVNKELEDRIATPHVAASEIYSSLTQGFLLGLMGGDRDIFDRSYKWAADAFTMFWDAQNINQTVDADNFRMGEIPRRWEEVVSNSFYRIIATSGMGPSQVYTLYNTLPLDAKVWCYAGVANYFSSRGFSREEFFAAFPPPPGLEEHQRDIERRNRLDNLNRQDIDTERQ